MAKKNPFKQDPPALKKAEEKQGKDLDGDNEKGEDPKHKAKVLGKGKAFVPFQKGDKGGKTKEK
jgi:hypothetical protein